MYDANYTNSHFELKESNIHGHKFAVKTKLSYQEPALDKTFLVYRQQDYGTVYQRMLLKQQPLICLKIDLIEIVGKYKKYNKNNIPNKFILLTFRIIQ